MIFVVTLSVAVRLRCSVSFIYQFRPQPGVAMYRFMTHSIWFVCGLVLGTAFGLMWPHRPLPMPPYPSETSMSIPEAQTVPTDELVD